MKKFIILILSFVSLYAHPHFFIDSFLDIHKDYLKHTWKFDRLNSKILMFEFDKNRNKKVDEQEKMAFINKYFEPLKKENYNLFIDVDGQEYSAKPEDIELQIVKKRVQLSFITKVSIKSGSTICTMDQSIYMAYKLNKIETTYKTEVEKSEYDYCIGVTK